MNFIMSIIFIIAAITVALLVLAATSSLKAMMLIIIFAAIAVLILAFASTGGENEYKYQTLLELTFLSSMAYMVFSALLFFPFAF